MHYFEFGVKLETWMKENLTSSIRMEEDLIPERNEAGGLPGGLTLVKAGEGFQMRVKWDLNDLYCEYMDHGWEMVTRRMKKALRMAGFLRERTTAGFRRELPPDRRELFDRLCRLRTQCARSRSVPTYVVFNNRTIYGMALRMPVTEEEMLEISGVGKKKFALYGNAFLEMVREAVRETEGGVRGVRESAGTVLGESAGVSENRPR